MSLCLIIAGVNPLHMVKVLSSEFLHSKVTISSFEIHRYLGGDLQILPTNFGIHWGILSAIIVNYHGDCLMEIIFSLSFYTCSLQFFHKENLCPHFHYVFMYAYMYVFMQLFT